MTRCPEKPKSCRSFCWSLPMALSSFKILYRHDGWMVFFPKQVPCHVVEIKAGDRGVDDIGRRWFISRDVFCDKLMVQQTSHTRSIELGVGSSTDISQLFWSKFKKILQTFSQTILDLTSTMKGRIFNNDTQCIFLPLYPCLFSWWCIHNTVHYLYIYLFWLQCISLEMYTYHTSTWNLC